MLRLAIIGCLVLAACASSGTTADIPQSRTATGGVLVGGEGYGDTGGVQTTTRESNITTVGLTAPAAKLWPELVQLFQELGLPVTGADTTKLLVASGGQRLRTIDKVPVGRFFDCPATGYGNSAGSGDVFVTVQAQLLPVTAELSELRLEANSHVRLSTNNHVVCRSTGRLEARFRDALMKSSAKVGG